MSSDESTSVNINWSDEDQLFVATVKQYPSLSYLHKNPVEAAAGILDLVKEIRDDVD
jgi:hypothetical protein